MNEHHISAIGIVGLGTMGASYAYRLSNAGFAVHGYDNSPSVEIAGIVQYRSFAELCKQVDFLLLAVPAFAVTAVLQECIELIGMRQCRVQHIIDAGNTLYEKTIEHAHFCNAHGITFNDIGISGGVLGATRGFSVMYAGSVVDKHFRSIEAIAKALAANACSMVHTGAVSTAHFTKMVHNGIEYGYLQALAEGIQLLQQGPVAASNTLISAITKAWSTHAIVAGLLMQLVSRLYEEQPQLFENTGALPANAFVVALEELAAAKLIPVNVLHAAIGVRREENAQDTLVQRQIIAALRHGFGDHPVDAIPEDVHL